MYILFPQKKKRKKSKKKKDGSVSSDQDQTQLDSLTSLEDNQEKRTEDGGDSSDSYDDAKEETVDSLQTHSLQEDLPSSLAASNTGSPSEDRKFTQKSPGEAEESAKMKCQEGTDEPKEGEISEGNVDDNQTLKSADTPEQHSILNNRKTPKSDADKAAEAATDKGQQSAGKKSKNKQETITTTQSAGVQSASPKGKQSGNPKEKGKNRNDPQQKGKHLKDEENKEKNQTDQEQKKKHQEDQKQKETNQNDQNKTNKNQNKTNKNQDKQKGKDPLTHDESTSEVTSGINPKQNKNLAVNERVTIYFHAILSKDFKFDPEKDRIFVQAGSVLGSWKDNIAELFVTRDFKEHGFLVTGSVQAKKSDVFKSIPYKYVVYKHKKQEYEYEFIYKLDSSRDHTNRCLFVKPQLLTADGDWHQYDDIICVEPSKGLLQRVKEKLFSEKNKDIIQGRMIAGDIMLETIFDLLSSWSETNLRSFQIQLSQFFQVYGNPFVFEEKGKKWSSLDFGEDDVRRLLKEFMLGKVMPQLRDKPVENCYIRDPLKAAVIVLHVCRQYGIRLNDAERHRLCTALCLPKKEKDAFHEYWTDLSQTIVPVLHRLGQCSAFVIRMMKDHSHLMEVDSLLIRSCLFLMSFDKLMEFMKDLNAELLDVLLVVTQKVPQEITVSSFEVSSAQCCQIVTVFQPVSQLKTSKKQTQSYSVSKLFESLTITWKFWKLISTIIEKSWPRDSQGHYQDDEEVVLRHLLSWTAAKDIFHLHGNIVRLITTSACFLRNSFFLLVLKV
uniref:Uncharacterized protein n=1 Tax=Oryzias latipes TaxID=8090 RepID=A0A3P9LF72_ORYLA